MGAADGWHFNLPLKHEKTVLPAVVSPALVSFATKDGKLFLTYIMIIMIIMYNIILLLVRILVALITQKSP